MQIYQPPRELSQAHYLFTVLTYRTTRNIIKIASKFRLHSPKKMVLHVLSTKRLEPSACTDTFLFQTRVFFVASSLRACTKASQHTYHKSSSLSHYAWPFSTFDTLRCERLLTSFTLLRLSLSLRIIHYDLLQGLADASKLTYRNYSNHLAVFTQGTKVFHYRTGSCPKTQEMIKKEAEQKCGASLATGMWIRSPCR